jgi:proteasome lid subunit RPN8/RPN11
LSYVSIWKPVHDRIVQAARDTRTEIIGLLIGRLEDDTIIVEDSTTDEFASEPHRVTLPASSLARIANDLVTGRLKGNIVGWYHSHTAGGLFFSETDIATQRNLQQFSSLITGMVVDSSNGEVGYFRVIPQTETAIRLPSENVTVYAEEKQAPAQGQERSEAAAASSVPPTPTVEVRRRPPRQQLLTYRLALAIILVALITSIAVFGALIYSSTQRASSLVINHTPVLGATIGSPIEISANITGTARNVTLVYGPTPAAQYKAAMNSTSSGEYSYTIPGTTVTGNIAYYIIALDAQGNRVKTPTYQIAVADFNPIPQSGSLTVYRTRSILSEINLLSINNFNEPLSLSSTGTPTGLTVTFPSNPVSAGSFVNFNVTANDLAPNGTYPITITATYSPPQSTPVSRQATVEVTIADFGLQISPTSTILHPGLTTSLTVTLTLEKGFVDPVTINVLDLPHGTTFTVASSNPTVLSGSPGTTTITVQITAPMTIKLGTYTVQIQAVGAGIVHIQAVELIVR